ncbi:MAG: hypothetical protein ACFFC7_05340 [Candidatus Hermodarchaeota archaeon]
MHITSKIPVMSDRLTKLKQVRLEALTGRDTTVIRRYLEILQKEGDKLLSVKDDGTILFKVDKSKLDELTLTSRPLTRTNKKTGEKITHPGRPNVKYDLKKEFNGKISVRELKECRDTAVEVWNAYLERVQKHQEVYWKIVQKPNYVDREAALVETLHWWETEKKPTPPCSQEGYKPKKLPRRATLGTTAWIHTDTSSQLTPYWLEIYYTVRSRTGKGKKATRM